MKVLSKTAALQVTKVILFLAGLMDIRRGVAHTFNVRYSAEYLAGIEPISDSLVLMGAFGISNFLTGIIYFLILWKAPKLAPYILLIMPFSYLIGGIGFKVSKCRNGISFYWSICHGRLFRNLPAYKSLLYHD